ncbi:MAG: helix-turn-helix transcriptional regulator [Pseudomonadota bacterium]
MDEIHAKTPPDPVPELLAELARLVEMAEGPLFCETLAAFLQGQSGYDSALFTLLFRDAAPCRVYDNLDVAIGTDLIEAYLGGAYLLDPFYTLFQERSEDFVAPLEHCAPDDFKRSEYWRKFYRDTGLLDECGLLINLSPEAALLISLGSRSEAIKPDARVWRQLEALLPMIAVLSRRAWPNPTSEGAKTAPQIGRHIERAVDAFGRSVLSAREAQTLQLILRGHSSKSIARILGNAPETVRAHRKRVYAKLGVASQGALFSAFLDAVSASPHEFRGDPLVFARDPPPSDDP